MTSDEARAAQKKDRQTRRTSLWNRIQTLMQQPKTELRDLKVRVASLEKELVDSWQIAEHFEFRSEKLREALLEVSEPAHVKLVEADWRAEADLPLPSCKHCGKELAKRYFQACDRTSACDHEHPTFVGAYSCAKRRGFTEVWSFEIKRELRLPRAKTKVGT